ARNNIETEKERQGPLQVFAPGVHEKYYWLPFVGDNLCWTLSGNTVCADSMVRGCTMDDYTFMPKELSNSLPTSLAHAPPPTVRRVYAATVDTEGYIEPEYVNNYPYLGIVPLDPPDGDWDELDYDSIPFEIPVPAPDDVPIWKIIITDYTIKNSAVSELYFRALLDGRTRTEPVCTKDNDLPFTSCTKPIAHASGIHFVWAMTDPITDDVEFDVRLRDKEPGVFDGETRDLIFHEFTVSADGTELTAGDETRPIGPDGKWTLEEPDDSGWWMQYDVIPNASIDNRRICAAWHVQWVGGQGEDEYASREKQYVPASFAYAKFSINGAVKAYDNWTGFYPLDKDGCVPEDLSPSFLQLEPQDENTEVEFTFELLGTLGYHEAGTKIEDNYRWKITEKEVDDPIFRISKTFTDADMFWSGNARERRVFSFDYNNEYTKAAAIVSHLLKRNVEGVDMGLSKVNDDMSVICKGRDGDTAGTTPYDPHVILRADSVMFHGDATRKFTVAHELGHLLHFKASNSFIRSAEYDVVMYDEFANLKTTSTSPSLPDECKCAIGTLGTVSLHCMQSLEHPTAAVNEGFANFYSAKMWNEPTDTDCVMGYSKWMYVPECPTGTLYCSDPMIDACAPCDPSDDDCRYDYQPRCYDAAPWFTENWDYLAFEDKDSDGIYDSDETNVVAMSDWKVVQSPVPVECNLSETIDEWKVWRNQHCIGTADENATGPGYTSDLRAMGTEIDWMKFFWELNTSGDQNARLEVAELLDVVEHGTLYADTDTSANSEIVKGVTYSDLKDAVELAMDTDTQPMFSNDQFDNFVELSRRAGVNNEL
ncbi:MAG: hypothetical protein JXX29_06695, partial [Deltaproteobacteria bacterium]|nr:hypothetical protein [Deltaproteobacteria bacterium]MBN2671340.1 hypothetical protein [Deltaproteobacteria bacterium]